jgi:regulator of sirC expression with transglutaminase-like and TPR domain
VSHLPVHCRPLAFRTFAERVSALDAPGELFRAAWALALHEHPDADLAAGETVVENLAATVNKRVRSPHAEARLAHLHDVLFEVYGLQGNDEDYYQPANSYLNEVLRTRRGIPISLVLIYRCVAAQCGLVVHGVNSPGHFLAEVELAAGKRAASLFVDPFYGGAVLNRTEALERIAAATGQRVEPDDRLFARASGRQWLLRMLNNLQAVFAAAERERDVFAMQELQTLL